jgi:hypothetical protein
VYAGAAREAVFSVRAVIQRVNADFVPLALRAPLVNGADAVKDEDEKWLYQRINRVKLAPQGICVLDSRGQVLTWAQMFDSNQSVLDFLDHSLKRFQKNAEAKPPVVTERYLSFPSRKVEDFRDEAKLPMIARGHPKGKTCPAKHAKGKIAPEALVAQLVGRALDGKGKPLADVVNQEHYVEDRFIVPPEMQAAVAKALANAEKGAVRLPDRFAQLCATHAHLGHIDVRPLFGVGDQQNKGKWKRCEFRAEKVKAKPEASLWRIEGQSEVVSKVVINAQGVHDVKLTWEGFVEMKGQRMIRLLLSARGTEKLQFAKDDHPLKKVNRDEVAFLPAGRPIDVNCGVRYGILGAPDPVLAEETADAAEPAQDIPDESRKELVQVLGGAFIIFRDKVQEELKLSDEQKAKLQEKFPEHVQETMKVFDKVKDLKPQEREKVMQEHRRKSDQKLTAFLKDVLEDKQRERLFQLQLQQAGAFALLGQNEAFLPLKITEEQRKQFRGVVQDMEKKIQTLIKDAGEDAKPEDILPKVMKLRREHEARIQAILTDAQRSQWKKLLGKPFDLGE